VESVADNGQEKEEEDGDARWTRLETKEAAEEAAATKEARTWAKAQR
jgi:hypothetical protein